MSQDRNPLNNLHMPYARFLPDGAEKEVLVQPTRPNERPAKGYVAYDPVVHYKKLKCPHCDIRADFTKGSGSTIAGDNLWGSRPHLRKQPDVPHEAHCILPLLDNKKDTVYDLEAGYRIHLKGPWTEASGRANAALYERGPDLKIRIKDDRLIGMQPVKVESVEELIRFIRLADPERLKRSFFINRDAVIPHSDFIVRYDAQSGHESFRNLVKRLRSGTSHPVLMEMRMYRPVHEDLGASQAIHIEKLDSKGRLHDIVPYVRLASEAVIDAMPDRGVYLVMGTPVLSAEPTSRKVEHALEMSIKSMTQVAQADLNDLERRAREHQAVLAERRASRQPG